MAMSVGNSDGDEDVPMSDINTTPLVDVMLVLLIIFLIAIPVAIQSIPIELPRVRNEITETKKENVSLTVRGAPGGGCEVYWNLTPIDSQTLLDRGVKALETQIAAVGGVENVNEENMPEVHIRGDINTPYKCIGGTVFTMQRAGFARVGFISQPPVGAAAE
ncbi:biopolymer transporter ExbD [Sphingomonas sp. LY29]|uniref:ExbD/TolR family protein n=1 Tax=unclassified Sphingomonas TaxID=196159 RepID=UPI002ADEA8AE|nr:MULTISPECIES: biopolymer transporter ExbD [unclassified Sphingomonas]MEA1073020.1 biopolymer transporter ExbD [Sphingomonas sp. LY160]WRP26455.1 biopolymer transporter ExbD [Sphingomonas sp. LY29]